MYEAEGLVLRYTDSYRKSTVYEGKKNEYGQVTVSRTYQDEKLTGRTFYEYEYDQYDNWIIRYSFYGTDGEKGYLQSMEERIFHLLLILISSFCFSTIYKQE